MNIQETFEKYSDGESDEFLKFDRVKVKLSNRPDLHAFMLLDKIIPGSLNIVGGASHDEIWLEILPCELAERATKEQIVELIRCGVRYDSSVEALVMFT